MSYYCYKTNTFFNKSYFCYKQTSFSIRPIIVGNKQALQYNNNKHFFNLQVANSLSRLRFEANLSRESSECTEHSQDQMSQINTGKTVYVGNA